MFSSADVLYDVVKAIQAERIREAEARRLRRRVKVGENGVSRKSA